MNDFIWYSRLAVWMGALVLLVQAVTGRGAGFVTVLAVLALGFGFLAFVAGLAFGGLKTSSVEGGAPELNAESDGSSGV